MNRRWSRQPTQPDNANSFELHGLFLLAINNDDKLLPRIPALLEPLKPLDLLSDVRNHLVLQLPVRRAHVRLADLSPRDQVL